MPEEILKDIKKTHELHLAVERLEEITKKRGAGWINRAKE